MKKNLVKLALIVPVALGLTGLLLIAGAVFYLKTDHARALVLARINPTFPATVQLDGHRFSALSGELILSGFRLMGPDGDRLVSFDRLALSVDWLRLFRKQLRLRRVVVICPKVRLQRDAAGSLDLVRALERNNQKIPETDTPRPMPFFNVAVDALELRDGRLRFHDAARRSHVELANVALDARADAMGQSGQIDLRITGLDLALDGASTVWDACRIKAALNTGKLEILDASVAGPAGRITALGAVADIFTDPALDVAIDARVFLPQVRRILDIDAELTGTLAAGLQLSGAWADPDARIAIDFSGGRLAGVPVAPSVIRCMLAERRLTISRCESGVAGGKIAASGTIDMQRAFAGGNRTGTFSGRDVSYRLSIEGRGMNLANAPLRTVATKGTVGGSVTVEGAGILPAQITARTHLQLAGKGVRLTDRSRPMDIAVSGNGRIDRGRIGIRTLSATIGAAVLHVTGSIDLTDASADLNLALDAPDMGAGLEPLGIDGLRGNVALKGRISGNLQRPVVEMTLEGRGVGYGDVALGHISAQGRIDASGMLHIQRLRIQNNGGTVSASGTLPIVAGAGGTDAPRSGVFSAAFDQVRADAFYPQDVLGGQISGKLHVTGTINGFEAEAILNARALAVKGIPLGDADIDLRWTDGKLVLEAVNLQNRTSAVQASGWAQLVRPGTLTPIDDPPIRLAIRARSVQVQDFADRFAGTVTAQCDLHGSLKRPEGSVVVVGSGLDLGFQRLDHLRVGARLAGDRVRIDEATIGVRGGEVVRATGWIAVDRSFALDLSSDAVSIDHIDRLSHPDIMAGKVALNVSASGTLDAPRASGRLTVRDVRINRKPTGDLTVELDLADGRIRVRGQAPFDLDGTYDLKSRHVAADLRFRQTELAPFFTIAGHPDFGGTLTGTVAVSGDVRAPETMRATVDLSEISLTRGGAALVRSGRIAAVADGAVLSVSDGHLALFTDGTLDLNGRIDVRGPLELTASGRIPLQAIAPLTDAVADPVGTLALSATIRGTRKAPEINGQLDLIGIGCRLPETGQRIFDGSGRIDVTNDAVRLETIRARIETGHFLISGTIDLKGIQPDRVAIGLTAEGVPIDFPETLSMVLNTDLKLTGTADRLRLQGGAVIVDGVYVKDVAMGFIPGTAPKKRKAMPRTAAAKPSMFADTALDIAVTAARPFQVDNNLAQLEIAPDLRVAGTLGQPVVTGRASIASGTVSYRKKQFEITEGIADFINPYRIAPEIRLKSETRVRDWAITLQIEGPPDALVFHLSADPPASDGDIVSLLMFGRTTGELIGDEGGATGSPAQMIAGLLAPSLEREIRARTGLDIVEMDTGAAAGAGDAVDVKVTLGRELSRNITIKYAVESGLDGLAQRVIAEYKLLENLLINGYQGTRGTFGGELRYRLEFR